VKKVLIIAPVFVVLIVAGVFKFIAVRNALEAQRKAVAAQWMQVDQSLADRADLIPKLVTMLQGSAPQETPVIGKIADARAALAAGRTPQEKIQANDRLSVALGRLLLAAEAYPRLRSNRNFLEMQDEIADSENHIAIERRKYNEVLEHYNAQIQIFPDNIVASISGFRRNDAYFRTDGANGGVPKLPF